MRISLLLFNLCIFSFNSFGQFEWSTSQILSTAKHQPQFQLQERKLDFLKNTTHDLPLINRWEFRTQTHDFDLLEQRFTFRVRPNSRKERNGQKQLHLSTIQYYEEETRQVLLDGLQERYEACLTVLFAQKRRRVLQDLETVYEALAITYEEKGAIDQIIEIAEVLQEFSIEKSDYQLFVERALRKLQYYKNEKGEVSLINSDFISLEDLKERIAAIKSTTAINHPSLSLLENEINLVEKEIDFEATQQKKWFNFAQLRYGGSDPFTPFRETVSVAFAFKLPVKGNSRLKTNKLELERIGAENDWGVADYQIKKEQKNIYREMTYWLEQHEDLTKKLIATQEKMTQSFNVNNTTDYQTLSLKIRIHLLKKQLRINQIEEKIYQSYINWLAITGKMIELPLVNYLTLDLKRY